MFEREFDGLPREVEIILRKQLEDLVLLVSKRYNVALRDYSVSNYTPEQLSAMIAAIFTIAARIKSDAMLQDQKE